MKVTLDTAEFTAAIRFYLKEKLGLELRNEKHCIFVQVPDGDIWNKMTITCTVDRAEELAAKANKELAEVTAVLEDAKTERGKP